MTMTETATLTKATATPLRRSDWASVPRVNLLPPEITQARRFVRLQRQLAAVVLVAVTGCAAGAWWAQTRVGSAQAELDAARSQTAGLQADKAKYAEVPQVSAQIDAALATREQAMAGDVLWSTYLNDVALATSTNVWLTSMSIGLAGTDATAASSSGPLAPAGVGSVQISGQASSLPDVAAWLESLDGIAGIKGSALASATRDGTAGSGGLVTFSSTSVLTPDALSHRYDRKAS